MMTQCLECGYTEIIPDLNVFTKLTTQNTDEILYMALEDPAHKGAPVLIGFRAAICGDCGHVEFYTRRAADLQDAHKKGYVTRKTVS
ncbi:MAG: hypothetical protein JW704_07720 [Anaerolineaceae bacterium]|nr:hypothetical protein [Anaerolineaceae bacterium]